MLTVVPVSLAQANDFVESLHRHHNGLNSHKFSIGAVSDGRLVGVAIVQRPAARMIDDGQTAEVARVCTDGTANACSFLYGACARIAKQMGYYRIGTYILESEPGTSLKAAGWIPHHQTDGESWERRTRKHGGNRGSGSKAHHWNGGIKHYYQRILRPGGFVEFEEPPPLLDPQAVIEL